MRSTIQLVGGGAAAVIAKIPTYIKVPFLMGVAALGGAELNKDINESWRSGRIFEGQASQGDAQSNPDVVKTLADLKAGKPTPAATATIAVTYEKTEAEAKRAVAERDAAVESEATLRAREAQSVASSSEQMRLRELDLKAREIALREKEIALRESENSERSAIAAAANESEEDLLRKLKRGIKLTSTESQKLSEIRRMRAEAVIKEGESIAAEASGVASKQASEIASKVFTDMQRGGGQTPRAMGNMARSILNGKF